jgi:HSP20 family protein
MKEIEIKSKNEKLEREEKEEWSESEGELVVDLFETDEKIVLQSPIAGVRAEDLKVFVENDMLIIKGERKRPKEQKNKKYFLKECYFGPFLRKIILPVKVDLSKVEAAMREGILTIEFPKIKIEEKKEIKVNFEE